ncbi:MAG TPA: hypothetical protein VMO24_01930 [Woeseiaceae bacterium]|nr:hypothetical protein [Woeseiaceae bacterium]
MAEAEEVISDVARHATVFARDLWRRNRDRTETGSTLALADVASRLDLVITSVFGTSYPIRVAQAPAPSTFLSAFVPYRRMPLFRRPLPATDGERLWLPANLGIADASLALIRYRIMALQQAMRAHRGSANAVAGIHEPVVADIFLVLEAAAADAALRELLPGVSSSIEDWRRLAVGTRPAISDFPRPARPLESFLRTFLLNGKSDPDIGYLDTSSPTASLQSAINVSRHLGYLRDGTVSRHGSFLMKDWWTGELQQPAGERRRLAGYESEHDNEYDAAPPRSARLSRRPKIREASDNEDDEKTSGGAWMVQADEPHQKAEDPMGLQRPTDRGEEDAQNLAEMLTELPEARLVSAPGRHKEVLLSDDPPESRVQPAGSFGKTGERSLQYPEWDFRSLTYRMPGTTVREFAPQPGSQSWVDSTLEEHRAMLELIRRRFEMLQARRVVLRKQQDGDEIDLEACIDALADLRAGVQVSDGLYRRCRPMERNMAIMLLIDVSGSTDGWVSAHRRIIDVEREALLLVCIALKELGEPYAVQAFSGEGPGAVAIRPLKQFDEPYDNGIALRIAALEPERYTRAGAAIRHATATLMSEAADHRLLLLLSDGKPNDVDDYSGRYGVEDMHRAVIETRLQGIFPFCLTIDRQAANYLPQIFGANQYAMLPRPDLLPTVLLDWMRRLLKATRN